MRHVLVMIVVMLAVSALGQGVPPPKPLSQYDRTMLEAKRLREEGAYEESESTYNRLIKRNRRDVDALLGRGLTRLRIKGQERDALADFNRVIVLAPGYMDARIGAATSLRRLGKDEDAVDALDAAARECAGDTKKLQSLADAAWQAGHWEFARGLDPDYTKVLSPREQQQAAHKKALDEARQLRVDGSMQASVEAYDALLVHRPADVDALLGRGWTRLRISGLAKDALSDFRQVTAHSPGYVDAHLGVATALRRLGKDKEAVAALRDAERACRGDEEKLRNLADAAWGSGHWEFARRLAPQYAEVQSPTEKQQAEHKQILEEARRLRIDGSTEDAEGVYNALLERNDRDVDALLGRGWTRLRIAGRAKDSLADFRQVIEQAPGYLDAHIGNATALRRLGRDDEVKAALDAAVQACGDSTKRLQYLADGAWKSGHWAFARGLDPKYMTVQSPTEQQQDEYAKKLEEARTLRLDGFTDDAEDIYNSLLERNPNDVDALAGLGFCKLRARRDLDQALEEFLRVIELSPDYTDAYIGAAMCYKRMGERDNLESILEQARAACEGSESKMRYLATTAWRQGYYPLARDIDDDYPPERDRDLIRNAAVARLTYGHSWVEAREDWDELRFAMSYRPRPDITLGGEYDRWWRYGTEDDSMGFSLSYRHNYKWSARYVNEVSDNEGFLAEQRHNGTLSYRLYRSLFVYGGPRFARYSGEWSERAKIGASTYWGKYFADAYYSAGTDTKKKRVSSYGISGGYNYELRHSIVAGYSKGEETIDFLRGGDVIFESDDVENIFIRGRMYFSETFAAGLGYMHEYRNSDLFRRELTISIQKAF